MAPLSFSETLPHPPLSLCSYINPTLSPFSLHHRNSQAAIDFFSREDSYLKEFHFRLNLSQWRLRPNPISRDFLPLMAEKLGGDGLIGELCSGFQLLKDSEKGVITFDSLKKNSALLGLQDLSDDDLFSMLKEGDFDGDGALNQMEFCVLMFRLSPELMEQSQLLLEDALEQEGFQDFDFCL